MKKRNKNKTRGEKMNKKRKRQMVFGIFLAVLMTAAGIFQNARKTYAYTVEDVGESRLYETGTASIQLEGPLGTDRLDLKFTNLDYKNCKVDTFKDNPHNIQIEKSGKGGGVYNTSVEIQKVKTKKNPDTGVYSYIDFVIKYDIPAHQQYQSEKKDGIAYKFSTEGNFEKQAVHTSEDRKQISLRCTTSVNTIGLCTLDQKKYCASVLTLKLQNMERKITYDKNGENASLSFDTKTFKDGEKYEFPEAKRAGYELINWKDKEGNCPSKNTTVCGDQVLYAQWSRKNGNFNLNNVIHDQEMFTGDTKLKGGNGTGYDDAHTDSEYARIDKEGKPGYFTKKGSVK